MKNRPSKSKISKPATAVAIIIVVLLIAVVYILALTGITKTSFSLNTSTTVPAQNSSFDPYAHLAKADFALVSQANVLASNQQFVSLAGKKYNFMYANASNFTSVEDSQFLVIVLNGTSGAYFQLARRAFNATVLDYALSKTRGVILSGNATWAPNQTVFVLAGYKTTASLSNALLSFFVKQLVYSPQKVITQFVNYNGVASNSLGVSNPTKVTDPVMDAYLDGGYELGAHDSSLYYPYNYYIQFAYLLYQAPVVFSIVPGFHGNASGMNLPMDALLCVPPPPPIPGSSICVGDYIAMPMFQVGAAAPSRPQWSLDSADCDFPGIDECIDTEGWVASGINPQLPYSQIPSVLYGFSTTLSGIPPSLTGTTGPAADWLPLTWWNYGPGSVSESTGGVVQNLISQNETQLLMAANVEVYSTPYNETPYGNFTGTGFNSSTGGKANVTYSCFSSYCGMAFNYAIYALMTENSNLPPSISVITPRNYSTWPGTGYYPLLQPLTLSTPPVIRASSTTYYFSYWSVYSEIGSVLYYNRYTTANATFQVIGPTQVEAIYTHQSMPGRITVRSGFMTPGTMNTCPPPLNCSTSSFIPINSVNFIITSLSGAVIASNITNSSGESTTPVLPAQCYQVSARKRGYVFLTEPNPLCVNGNGGVDAVDLSLYVIDVKWPSTLPYSTAPPNSKIPLDVTLLYSNGDIAGNMQIMASSSSGTINNSVTTSANGTAHFVWSTGSKTGLYRINFTPLSIMSTPPPYSVPVMVILNNSSLVYLNISLSNSTVSGSPGTSITRQVTAGLCMSRFSYPANMTTTCTAALPIQISMARLPDNVNYSFSPNPVQSNSPAPSATTSLNISFGASVLPGIYDAKVIALATLSNGIVYSGAVPLTLIIKGIGGGTNQSCSSVLGGIRGEIYRYGELTPANVTIRYGAFNGTTAYTSSTTTGLFNTSYILKEGSYVATAYAINMPSYAYGTATANVTPCDISNVTIPSNQNTTTSTTSTTTTTSTITSTTTVSQGYYQCGVCNRVPIAGYTCPPSCPTSTSCTYGGFSCG